MPKPQPKQETILLDEDPFEEQELISPYRQRVYRDTVHVQKSNNQMLEEFSTYEDSGLTFCGVPIYFSRQPN